MPCQDTIYFPKPQKMDRKIWRYLDFAKFISLLETRSLYFTSLTKMADKFDKYEGHYPYPQVPMKDTSGIMRYLPLETFGHFDLSKYGGLINCWHINEHESYAMWEIYSNRSRGIAIQSTIQKLWDSFNECKNDIYLGEVEYIDYEELLNEEWQRFHPKHLYLYKRKYFEYENELRVIVELVSVKDGKIIPWDSKEGSTEIPINIDCLIESIWISPYSPDWYKQLVTKILTRYKIKKSVLQSSIDKKPI